MNHFIRNQKIRCFLPEKAQRKKIFEERLCGDFLVLTPTSVTSETLHDPKCVRRKNVKNAEDMDSRDIMGLISEISPFLRHFFPS